jgi:hypothetical protein
MELMILGLVVLVGAFAATATAVAYLATRKRKE